MSTEAELVVVGRLGAPHGVSGAIRVTSATEPPDNIEHYRPWLIGRGGEEFRQVAVTELTPGNRGYVARFAGISDREQARALSGLLVAVPRSALPELESDREYYWQDLIGMTVENTAGQQLGVVERLLETGAHDVLVIQGAERETLVPFAEAFVVDVNAAERRIIVEWQDPA